ncbi:MAG: hypothetical protein P8M70_01200 [Verrucomicrobiota bacterium]|nr:hypothetical protein [Verrucomicrobiota bacterium]
MDVAAKSHQILSRLPEGGLFGGHQWRIAPKPFPLDSKVTKELETLGRILHKFYQAADLLYRQSVRKKQPDWIAQWLERGKPQPVIELQRDQAFKNQLPRVIRPDILLTQEGWHITELDSVPGGIGLTSWLNETYDNVIGGRRGMLEGFSGIFQQNKAVYIMVSEESKTYRPEMEWLSEQLDDRFSVCDSTLTNFNEGDSVYRFFELFDLPNIEASDFLFASALKGGIQVTAPPKSHLEEKMLFALFWNQNLKEFWRKELGAKYTKQLEKVIPETWIIDPSPIPPHAAIPRLNLTNWNQLSNLSQKEREFILKLSGFNERAWGSRSIRLGADLSQTEWAESVDTAISEFEKSPWVLQRYKKPRVIEHDWFNFETEAISTMKGRVRLCPYYFIHQEDEVRLGGILATICPADKKIIHGMRDAIMVPCSTV